MLNSNDNSFGSEREVTFDKVNNALSFSSRDQLKGYVKEKIPTQKIIGFYEEGFKPNRVVAGLDESELDKVASIIGLENLQETMKKTQKKNIASKNTNFDEDYEYEGEDEDLIKNEEFASLLNSDREIIVNDTIFKYTEKGVVFTSLDKVNKLRQLDISSIPTPSEGINNYEGVNIYVPHRAPIDEYLMQPVDDPYNGGGYTGGGGSTNNDIPENFDYVNCSPSRSFFDNIFGKEYACEYKFNSKRKLRTIFAVEDYYLFFDVYAQAKFKQKTWLGWYSCRDASTVFLKVDKAQLKFKRRTLNIKIGVKQQQLVDFYKKLLDHKDKIIHISNEFDMNGGEKAFSLSESDVVSSYGNKMIVPNEYSWKNNSNFKYSNLFGNNINKIIVINVLGKNITVTDHDIYSVIYKYLKDELGSKMKSTAVIIKKDNIDDNNVVSTNIEVIDYAKDLVKVNNLAVARKTFKFPKEFELKSFQVGYTTDPQNLSNGKIKVDIDFGWNAVKAWDVSVKSGALYEGKWGGSSFAVKRD
ncbi:hypothetical protein PG623_01980 [Riemerella anatipestifer]|nr:hypothetical protein [Riemerella anatipestifer]